MTGAGKLAADCLVWSASQTLREASGLALLVVGALLERHADALSSGGTAPGAASAVAALIAVGLEHPNAPHLEACLVLFIAQGRGMSARAPN
jgi:hypothetical protein